MTTTSRRTLRLLAVILVPLALGGCASWTRQEGAAAQPALSRDSFVLEGKLGVRGSGGNANLQIHWTQEGDRYEIVLRSILGQGVARVVGRGLHIRVETAGEEAVESDDAETLFETRVGWRFPVLDSRYWVHGEPAPGPAESLRRDAEGRIAEMAQGGWDIQYLRYEDGLPVRMRLERPEVRLLLVVTRWLPGSRS